MVWKASNPLLVRCEHCATSRGMHRSAVVEDAAGRRVVERCPRKPFLLFTPRSQAVLVRLMKRVRAAKPPRPPKPRERTRAERIADGLRATKAANKARLESSKEGDKKIGGDYHGSGEDRVA